MKKIVLLIIISFLHIINSYSQSTWYNTFVNNSSTITKVLPRDSNTCFAFTYDKTYLKTTNNGNNWLIYKLLDTTIFIPDGQFLNSQTGWIVGGYSQNSTYKPYLFKTTNGGLNWNNQNYNYALSELFCVYYLNENTGFVGGRTGDSIIGIISRTTNNGVIWNTIKLQAFNSILKIKFTNDLTGWALGTGSYFAKTTDCGISWNNILISSPLSDKMLFDFYTSDGINIWITCEKYPNYYVYYTSNSGINWNLIYTCSKEYDNISFLDNNTGFLCGSGDFLKTTNGGYNWFVSSNISFNVFCMCIYNNNIFVGGGTNGVSSPKENFTIKSSNLGSTWSQYEYNWDYAFTDVHFINANEGLALATYNATFAYPYHNKIFKTTNSGINWVLIYQRDSIQLDKFAFADNSTGFINSSDSKILRTTNYGLNWNIITSPNNVGATKFLNPSLGWSFSGDYMIKTTNAGLNWQSYLIPEITTYSITDFNFINESTGWVLASKSFFYYPYTFYNTSILKTTNSGNNWQLTFHLEQQTYYYSKFKFFDNNNGLILSGNSKFLKTTNSGYNWNDVQLNFNITSNSFYMLNSNTGWIFGSTNGLSKTTNGGHNWFTQFSNNSTSIYSIISLDSNNVWFGSNYSGVYHTTNGGGTIGIKQLNGIIPNYFYLSQNYPNPFNPVTNIRYDLPKNSMIKLVVFDLLGREIKTLVNEKQSPGSYNVSFDASSYPSGVYFYRISTEDFSETKKMILLK